jgi:hypothetical protein
VNRWAHEYAYTPNSLFDLDWKEEEKPWVIGRTLLGKIAIANSHAGASAYSDVAIDQAWSVVGAKKPEEIGRAGEDRFQQNELDRFCSQMCYCLPVDSRSRVA